MDTILFKGGRKIEPDSEDYNDVKYQLQISTNGTFAFVELDIWKIDNIESSLLFERSYVDALKVPCWLKNSELGYENNIENIAKKGVTFPPNSGMKFSTGRFDLKTGLRNGKPVDLLLVLCDVAVGRALVIDEDVLQEPLPGLCVLVLYLYIMAGLY